jgi:hypothetical protein
MLTINERTEKGAERASLSSLHPEMPIDTCGATCRYPYSHLEVPYSLWFALRNLCGGDVAVGGLSGS